MSLKEFLAAAGGLLLVGGALWTAASEWSEVKGRVATLENQREWRQDVDTRISALKARQEIHERRWGQHFNLWGDAIERRSREINQPATDLSHP